MFNRKPNYFYRPRSAKYSNETMSVNLGVTTDIDGNVSFPSNAPGGPPGIVVVPATSVLGNRKVKNFTIKITANGNDDQIFGALVYVPEGTIASSLAVGGATQSMYEPNQNVISTFIIPPNVSRNTQGKITQMSAPTQITVSSRLARNLNTGDYIALVFSTPNGLSAGDGTGDNPEPVVISGMVNYAIKF